jgi:HD-like signal output (HDOD) protein
MSKINSAALSPGMVLGEDIYLPDGRLLMKKGTILDFEHLRSVRVGGVKEVDILDTDKPEPGFGATLPSVPDIHHTGEKAPWEKRFSKCDLNHPVILELYRLAALNLEFSDSSLQKDWSSPDLEAGLPSGLLPAEPPPKFKVFLGDPQSLIGPDLELVSLPEIFYQIEAIINNPRSSAFQIAEVISKDPGLSAKLLRIVNSAFYGFPKQVDTISRAVAIVGSDQLHLLTLGTSVIALFRDIPSGLMNMGWFWKHSLACGIAARLIGSYKNFLNIEQLFISGLLHDLGKLIIFKNHPREAATALSQAGRSESWDYIIEGKIFGFVKQHYLMERTFLGFDHLQVGLALAEKWKLPLSLQQAIGGHHDPLKYPPSMDAAVVNIADNLVNALGYGTSGEHLVAPGVVEVCEFLSLPGGFLEKLVPLINRQVDETFHLFQASA